jgi:uncharacterized protein
VAHVDGLGDDEIRTILKSVKTIAMVGASPNPARPSHRVLGFLIAKGFETYPVNPGQAGAQIRGRPPPALPTCRSQSIWSTYSANRTPPAA